MTQKLGSYAVIAPRTLAMGDPTALTGLGVVSISDTPHNIGLT